MFCFVFCYHYLWIKLPNSWKPCNVTLKLKPLTSCDLSFYNFATHFGDVRARRSWPWLALLRVRKKLQWVREPKVKRKNTMKLTFVCSGSTWNVGLGSFKEKRRGSKSFFFWETRQWLSALNMWMGIYMTMVYDIMWKRLWTILCLENVIID